MIKAFSIIILLFINLVCFGQNLTLDQAIAVRTKSLGSLEEYLTAKNWQLLRAENETDSTRSSVSFAFNKSIYDDTAEAFLYLYFSNTPSLNRLQLQINRRITYNEYLVRLKALGIVLTHSKIEGNSIIKTYKNNVIAVRVKASSSENDKSITNTTYLVSIFNRQDYELFY